MQDYDLLYPGSNQQAQTVRRNVAQALSNAHNEANPSKELADFLSDAASKAPGYTPPGVDANQIVLTDGDVVEVTSGRYTVRITAGVITDIDVA